MIDYPIEAVGVAEFERTVAAYKDAGASKDVIVGFPAIWCPAIYSSHVKSGVDYCPDVASKAFWPIPRNDLSVTIRAYEDGHYEAWWSVRRQMEAANASLWDTLVNIARKFR